MREREAHPLISARRKADCGIMIFTARFRMLLVLVMLGLSTLSGCMLYAKMPNGEIEQLSVSSHELFRFMKKFDDLSGDMIREANFRGERVLGKTLTQMRKMAFEIRRKSYSSSQTAIDLQMLERKFKAFDTQIRTRIHEAPDAPGAQAIYSLHYQLKKEVMRFKKLLENSIH